MSESSHAPESLQCLTCGRRFSRRDHLKRHQFRHTGQRPYNCQFCDEAFTRSDNLRDHYPACPQRNGRSIPEAARGGRRSHACDSCIAMKLGCDGNNPCKTCLQKSISCAFSRRKYKTVNTGEFDQDINMASFQEQNPSDRGSIQFLLNQGPGTFLSDPHLIYMNSDESRHSHLKRPEGEHQAGNLDTTIFQDNSFLRFLAPPQDWDSAMSLFTATAGSPFIQGVSQTTSVNEEPRFQSAALMDALMAMSIRLNFTPEEQAFVSNDVHMLFVPSVILECVSSYFERWHNNVTILHQPTFDLEQTSLPTLLSIILMGAMYSNLKALMQTAKRLLDLAEAYIFSIEDLADEGELTHMLRRTTLDSSSESTLSPFAFDSLFGGYMIVVAQFWGGTSVARKRVSQTRFTSVVKLARRMGILNVRHELDDCIDEQRWIKQEQHIHLISTIATLDCGFCFFANVPRRFSITELRFELQGNNFYLRSEHPFLEPGFVPTKNIMMPEAFQQFFNYKGALTEQINDRLLSHLDTIHLQLIIHLLYCVTHDYLINLSPVFSIDSDDDTQAPSANSAFFTDPTLNQMRRSLGIWRRVWDGIREKLSDEQWASRGFYRTAYHFWLVTQLVLSTPSSVALLLKMEIGCQDSLVQFRTLLPKTTSNGSTV